MDDVRGDFLGLLKSEINVTTPAGLIPTSDL